MAKKSWLKDNWHFLVIILLLLVTGLSVFGVWSPLDLGGEDETTTTSTVTLYSSVDREVVDLPVSIWAPDLDTEFDATDKEHLRPDTLGDYWEEIVASKDSEDIDIDLSAHEYLYFEINPDADTDFENDHIFKLGGSNQDFAFDVYHLPTDMYFENNARDDGTRGVPTADANFTLTVTGLPNHPSLDFDEGHYGDRFVLSTNDYNDLSASAQEKYNDEEFWTSMAPTYNPEDDTDKDYDDDLELYTKLPAFKFDMNDTVSVTDGEATQVNVTVENSEVEVLISGEYIYFVSMTEFGSGYTIDYEMELGVNITCSTLYSGTLDVPDDDESNIDFTAFSYSM